MCCKNNIYLGSCDVEKPDRKQTTSDLAPAQNHQLCFQEADRTQARMKEILTAEGYPFNGNSFGNVRRMLSGAERFLSPGSEEGSSYSIE